MVKFRASSSFLKVNFFQKLMGFVLGRIQLF